MDSSPECLPDRRLLMLLCNDCFLRYPQLVTKTSGANVAVLWFVYFDQVHLYAVGPQKGPLLSALRQLGLAWDDKVLHWHHLGPQLVDTQVDADLPVGQLVFLQQEWCLAPVQVGLACAALQIAGQGTSPLAEILDLIVEELQLRFFQEQMAAQVATLKTVFEALPHPILVSDCQGAIQMFNREFRHCFPGAARMDEIFHSQTDPNNWAKSAIFDCLENRTPKMGNWQGADGSRYQLLSRPMLEYDQTLLGSVTTFLPDSL